MTSFVAELTTKKQAELQASRAWRMAVNDLNILIEGNPDMQERYQMQFEGVEEMIARQMFPPEKKNGRR